MLIYSLKQNTFLLLSLALLISCGGESGPSYDFKDQNLQGQVNGKDWSMNSGSASMETQNSNEYIINLSDVIITDPCAILNFDSNQMLFNIPNKIGLYELNLDSETGEGLSVSFIDGDSETITFFVDGVVELLSITDDQVMGRIDINEGSGNSLNGNFTATLCQ